MLDCTSCGACCATYRVCFYWAEADALNIPEELVEPAGRLRLAMRRVEEPSPRCIALEGVVGARAGCAIYERRPQICRDVQPGDPSCLRARARHGLDAHAEAG